VIWKILKPFLAGVAFVIAMILPVLLLLRACAGE
jgi:hypothetical protein